MKKDISRVKTDFCKFQDYINKTYVNRGIAVDAVQMEMLFTQFVTANIAGVSNKVNYSFGLNMGGTGATVSPADAKKGIVRQYKKTEAKNTFTYNIYETKKGKRIFELIHQSPTGESTKLQEHTYTLEVDNKYPAYTKQTPPVIKRGGLALKPVQFDAVTKTRTTTPAPVQGNGGNGQVVNNYNYVTNNYYQQPQRQPRPQKPAKTKKTSKKGLKIALGIGLGIALIIGPVGAKHMHEYQHHREDTAIVAPLPDDSTVTEKPDYSIGDEAIDKDHNTNKDQTNNNGQTNNGQDQFVDQNQGGNPDLVGPSTDTFEPVYPENPELGSAVAPNGDVNAGKTEDKSKVDSLGNDTVVEEEKKEEEKTPSTPTYEMPNTGTYEDVEDYTPPMP